MPPTPTAVALGPLATISVPLEVPPTFALAGEVDASNAELLRTHLTEAVAGEPPYVVLDLADLAFLDSSGISVIVGLGRQLEGYGGRLHLQRVDGPPRRALEITGVLQLFGTD